MKNLTLLILLISFTNSFSQNLTLNETMDYINKELTKNNPSEQSSEKSKFVLIENGDIGILSYSSGNLSFIQRINIYDVKTIIFEQGRKLYLKLLCHNGDECATWESMAMKNTTSFNYVQLRIKNTRSGNKIKKAIEYFITKAKEQDYGRNDDPFDTFEPEKKQDNSINIMELKIGMEKREVFKILNAKPELELIENGFEVYRVRKQNQYFLYFSNNKLIRVDKGVRRADARIIIE